MLHCKTCPRFANVANDRAVQAFYEQVMRHRALSEGFSVVYNEGLVKGRGNEIYKLIAFWDINQDQQIMAVPARKPRST